MSIIIIFYISLSVSILLIVIKIFELRYEKKNFILRLISSLDDKSHKIIEAFKFRSFQIMQTIRYVALVQIKEVSKNIFHKTKASLEAEYRNKQDYIMGKIEIGERNSASFYLKKISEDKKNTTKGKIEDDSINIIE